MTANAREQLIGENNRLAREVVTCTSVLRASNNESSRLHPHLSSYRRSRGLEDVPAGLGPSSCGETPVGTRSRSVDELLLDDGAQSRRSPPPRPLPEPAEDGRPGDCGGTRGRDHWNPKG